MKWNAFIMHFGSTHITSNLRFMLNTIIWTSIPGSFRTWGSFHEAPLGCLGDGDGWHTLQHGQGVWGDTTHTWSNSAFTMNSNTIRCFNFPKVAIATMNATVRSEFKTYLCLRCQAFLASQKTAWPPQTTKTVLPWTPGNYSVGIFKQDID